MIEVKARLLRGCVYFAGETIECEIVFTCVEKTQGRTNNAACNHVDTETIERTCQVERLAWASAQIHCQCTANESRVIIPKRLSQIPGQLSPETATSSTSFVPSRGEFVSSFVSLLTCRNVTNTLCLQANKGAVSCRPNKRSYFVIWNLAPESQKFVS